MGGNAVAQTLLLLWHTGERGKVSGAVCPAALIVSCVFVTPEPCLFSFRVDMVRLTDPFTLPYLYV